MLPWIRRAVMPSGSQKLLSASSPFAWSFFMAENYTNQAKTQSYGHLLATADWPPKGCQQPILLKFTGFLRLDRERLPLPFVFCLIRAIHHVKINGLRRTLAVPGGPVRSMMLSHSKRIKYLFQVLIINKNFNGPVQDLSGSFEIHGTHVGPHELKEPCTWLEIQGDPVAGFISGDPMSRSNLLFIMIFWNMRKS